MDVTEFPVSSTTVTRIVDATDGSAREMALMLAEPAATPVTETLFPSPDAEMTLGLSVANATELSAPEGTTYAVISSVSPFPTITDEVENMMFLTEVPTAPEGVPTMTMKEFSTFLYVAVMTAFPAERGYTTAELPLVRTDTMLPSCSTDQESTSVNFISL